MANLVAPAVRKQGVSVTRKMAASLPGLRAIAQSKGLKVHHLGAGYPHPEVTDPRGFLKHQEGYFAFLKETMKCIMQKELSYLLKNTKVLLAVAVLDC